MKKKCLIPVICFILLCGCTLDGINQTTETTISESLVIESTSEQASLGALSSETKIEKERNNLTQADIDNICKELSYNIFNCKDGSQIICLTADYTNFYYIRYMPPLLTDGNYGFFRKLTPSYEVIYHEDGSVGIPLSINDSGEFQFMLRNQVLTFFNDEDDRFNQEYSALDYEEQERYRSSLVPDASMTEEELKQFLRNCVYNDNISVLDKLYALISEEDQNAKYRLELAAAYAGVLRWSEQNPYQPEIFYGESINLFPQKEILEVISESLQTGMSLEELGCEEVKSNFDWEEVWQTVYLRDSEVYLSDIKTNGIYKYDLNNDGLMEILLLFPGGSIGNEYWEIVFLDEEGGGSGSISDEGMSAIRLYCYKQQYFFLYPVRDFDIEFLGWKVYAIDKNRNISNAYVHYERIGSENIFNDKHALIDGSYYLDWDMNRFIEIYKNYSYHAVGKEIEPEKQVRELFQAQDPDRGIYGMLDINNDGIEDWTKVYISFPSYQYNYYFVDGKTQKLMDLGRYFKTQNYKLRCLIPYQIEDRNYFICVGGDYGNYIVKLIEIKGMELVEVHSWFVSIKKRILVQVFPDPNFQGGQEFSYFY